MNNCTQHYKAIIGEGQSCEDHSIRANLRPVEADQCKEKREEKEKNEIAKCSRDKQIVATYQQMLH